MQVADAPAASTDGSEARTGVPRWAGALVGVLGLAAGLSVGEFVAALVDSLTSPVVEVGNRVVDLVPKSLRDWAISAFGTSDKAVLLAMVVLVMVGLASLAGVWVTSGRRPAAIALVAIIIAAGALAPLGRGGAGWGSVLTILLAGGVAVAVMLWLAELATRTFVEPDSPASPSPPGVPMAADTEQESSNCPVPGSDSDPGRRQNAGKVVGRMAPTVTAAGGSAVDRRRFLGIAAGVAIATAALGGASAWLRSRAVVAAERLGITLPSPVTPLPPVPAEVAVDLEGVSPFITPNDDFFRIDTALVVPGVSVEDWTLRIHGMVDSEVTLDHRQLLDRPMVEVDATIACVSNVVGGPLIGNARWLGCRLDDLLDEAGIDPDADQIVGRSVDGFTAGFPTAVLDGRDALVAVGMNGEPLPTDHGYPARLIVPGLYGYVSATKWLSEIELTRFDRFEGYWIPRGWDAEAPVLTQSRIDTPKSRDEVTSGERLDIGGIAWSPIEGIEAVEVQLDDGPWEQAELAAELSGSTWRQWRHSVVPGPGEHEIRVRATDAAGDTQTGETTAPGPNGATGWHTVRVTAT